MKNIWTAWFYHHCVSALRICSGWRAVFVSWYRRSFFHFPFLFLCSLSLVRTFTSTKSYFLPVFHKGWIIVNRFSQLGFGCMEIQNHHESLDCFLDRCSPRILCHTHIFKWMTESFSLRCLKFELYDYNISWCCTSNIQTLLQSLE